MNKLGFILLISIGSLVAKAAGDSSNAISFSATDVIITISDHPDTAAKQPSRTLATRSFKFSSPKEFSASWHIEKNQLILDTSHSHGSILKLPLAFIVSEKQLSKEVWQIGSYHRDGGDCKIIMTIENDKK
jgi:hypothetical protein